MCADLFFPYFSSSPYARVLVLCIDELFFFSLAVHLGGACDIFIVCYGTQYGSTLRMCTRTVLHA